MMSGWGDWRMSDLGEPYMAERHPEGTFDHWISFALDEEGDQSVKQFGAHEFGCRVELDKWERVPEPGSGLTPYRTVFFRSWELLSGEDEAFIRALPGNLVYEVNLDEDGLEVERPEQEKRGKEDASL